VAGVGSLISPVGAATAIGTSNTATTSRYAIPACSLDTLGDPVIGHLSIVFSSARDCVAPRFTVLAVKVEICSTF